MPSRRAILSGFASSLTTACSPIAGSTELAAPEFIGVGGWLNTTEPLTLSMLRGKVVLVDFWTYSCINCRRTVPYLNRWQAEYGDAGLQIVGIHTPEFGFERTLSNVETSVRSFGIRYLVGQDNEFKTWNAWGNRAWPAFYLLDRRGRIVLKREGEGFAGELESAIRALLGLAGAPIHSGDDPDLSKVRSPEVYFGAGHPTPQDRSQSPQSGVATYSLTKLSEPTLDRYQLDGTWERKEEALTLRSAVGRVRIRFSAAKMHLVAGAPAETPIVVRVDGGAPREISIGGPTLYTLLDSDAYGEHLLDFEVRTAGLSLYSATFG